MSKCSYCKNEIIDDKPYMTIFEGSIGGYDIFDLGFCSFRCLHKYLIEENIENEKCKRGYWTEFDNVKSGEQ